MMHIRPTEACVILGLGLLGCVDASSLGTANAHDPCVDSASPLVCAGEASLHRGDHIRAAQYLEAAIDAGDREGRVMALLWRAYADSGRYADLRRSVREHLSVCPDDAEARALMAALERAGL